MKLIRLFSNIIHGVNIIRNNNKTHFNGTSIFFSFFKSSISFFNFSICSLK